MAAGVWSMIPESSLPIVVMNDVSLAKAAGTYDIFTASEDVLIEEVDFFVDGAAVGLTSLHVDTNNTAADALLASTLLAALTAGKNLPQYATHTVLKKGKKIQITIVGTGTGGDLKVVVKYFPIGPGARLS